MRKSILLLVVLLALFLPSAAAAGASDGVIRGQLVNKTLNGAGVASQEVTLTTSVNNAETGKSSARTDEKGNFEFRGLNTDASYSYSLTVIYQEAEYTSDTLSFATGETNKTYEFVVYDAISTDQALRVEVSHIILEAGRGSIQVTEYHVFVNEGDRTYVGARAITADGKKETLRFPLPAGASQPALEGGLMDCCIVGTPEGMSDTMAVMPGEKVVGFSYQVKPKGSRYQFSRQLLYPTQAVNFLVTGEGLEISSPELVEQGPVTLGGIPFRLLSAASLSQGATISAAISGLPGAGLQSSLKWVGVVLLVIAAALALGFPLLRKRGRKPLPALARREEREVLLDEIAALDDAYEAGRVPEAQYRRERERKKARLLELNRGLRGRRGSPV